MVVDHYREKGKTKTVSVDYVSEIVDPKINIHQKAILNADIELVKSAILKINKDHQDVIIMHYLEDMPTEQVAQLLGKPAGTVRVMIHRGLEALRNELGEQA